MANVLIVDDSRTSRRILRVIIEDMGNTVIGEAVNGDEGVAMFKELNPDIVTLDITMPVKDGVAALKEIMEINPKAKVIMVTAAGQKGNVVEAIKMGAFEFVTKPFDEEIIRQVFRKALS